jgi:single-stranded-DNA-specific exonuclease
MTRIVTRAPSPADAAVLVRHGVHPVIARLYASRGVCSPDEIETELKKLHAPLGLKGCDEAAVVLADALAS